MNQSFRIQAVSLCLALGLLALASTSEARTPFWDTFRSHEQQPTVVSPYSPAIVPSDFKITAVPYPWGWFGAQYRRPSLTSTHRGYHRTHRQRGFR